MAKITANLKNTVIAVLIIALVALFIYYEYFVEREPTTYFNDAVGRIKSGIKVLDRNE